MLRRNSILFLLLLILISCGDSYLNHPKGLEVRFIADKNMFPLSWHNEEIKPHANTLPMHLRPDAKSKLIKGFDKYPKDVLYENLDKVYVLGNLNFYGVDYGGTNAKSIVYVVHYDYLKDYVERTFHHEFGAVLMYNYYFDTTTFKTFISDSVTYGDGGIAALINGNSSTDFDYELIENGFLSEYGSSCVEEDFCSICEQLFKPEPDFWYVYENYPIMQKKIKYIIDFYHSIDTTFNLNYFKCFHDTIVM